MAYLNFYRIKKRKKNKFGCLIFFSYLCVLLVVVVDGFFFVRVVCILHNDQL